MLIIALIALALGMLHGCGGGGSPTANAPTPPSPPEVDWTHEAKVDGACCNYAPIVVRGHTLRVYSNSNRDVPDGLGEDGDYWLREGTMTGVAAPVRVLHIDAPADTYIRTSGVTVDAQGRYYALLWTGTGYPTTNGYSPSWATSPDGLVWTWHGNVSPVGRSLFSSSNTLVVNERTDDYRFMAWTDSAGGKLRMMHSADGMRWTIDAAEVLPVELASDAPAFPTVTKTPYGYHLIYANNWPATEHRHLWSCTGLKWRVLETEAPTLSNKGTNLAYDAGIVHAIVRGEHWSFPARRFTCEAL